MRTPAPTLTRSYSYAWQQFWKYFLHLFLVGLIYSVASIPSTFGFGAKCSIPCCWAHSWRHTGCWYCPSSRTEPTSRSSGTCAMSELDIRGVFGGFQTNYLNIVLANLLVFAIVGIGLALFLLPGIIFGCRLSFVTYLVMDRGLDPVAAIEKSWSMTRGHGWRIFGMYLLAIPLVFLGLGVLAIGAFFALIWVSCAFASLYHAVDLEERAALNANGTA